LAGIAEPADYRVGFEIDSVLNFIMRLPETVSGGIVSCV
jgi:hypothetical protein